MHNWMQCINCLLSSTNTALPTATASKGGHHLFFRCRMSRRNADAWAFGSCRFKIGWDHLRVFGHASSSRGRLQSSVASKLTMEEVLPCDIRRLYMCERKVSTCLISNGRARQTLLAEGERFSDRNRLQFSEGSLSMSWCLSSQWVE